MVRTDAAGRETWYGKWRVGGTQVKRRLGLKRVRGTRDGLTKTQAEAELRRIMAEVEAVPNRGQRMTLAEVGRALVSHRRSPRLPDAPRRNALHLLAKAESASRTGAPALVQDEAKKLRALHTDHEGVALAQAWRRAFGRGRSPGSHITCFT
jgi:hypothetical protein